MIKLVYTKNSISFIKILKGDHLFMPNLENISVFNISSSDTARFRKIVIDVLSESCKMPTHGDDEYGGIGTLGEKQMHAAIKRFICPDESCHEILLDGSEGFIPSNDENETNAKKRRFVADILCKNTVYEIQTGGFSPLKNKIQWILDNTSYNIVVIHPVAETKWISYINKSSGSIEKRTKSPQKGKFSDIASELFFFRDFLSSKRFSLVLLMMEAEEYRKNTATNKSRRPRYRKYEMIPISLLRTYIFKSVDDYKIFIPDDLDEPFTVKEYSSKSKIRGIDAYSIAKTLCMLGLLEECGKRGRAIMYKRTN